METETRHSGPADTPSGAVDLRVRPSGEFRIDTPCGIAYVTRDQLSRIVQQAYDVAGIAATPSYAAEAEVALDAMQAESYTAEVRRRAAAGML